MEDDGKSRNRGERQREDCQGSAAEKTSRWNGSTKPPKLELDTNTQCLQGQHTRC
ncbi:hypothetical protein DPMN_051010 [Dreissena polymorpha]|uniref:Uncharacterized protein n=1 Tax=Dreissena polymorpha TaxID=45954 RepID=A0A9D4CH51_DREPO|nr:hypothetical protein DPMN_051010 [Dreissena polymorpha]